MRSALAAWLLALPACGMGEAPSDPVPALDYEMFARDVQPVLEARCSNPTTCHGREDRPFSVYAELAFRRNSADLYGTTALTEDETRANFMRASSFATPRDGVPLLLAKPLGLENAGVRHEGGVVFTGEGDREYRALRDWLEGDHETR